MDATLSPPISVTCPVVREGPVWLSQTCTHHPPWAAEQPSGTIGWAEASPAHRTHVPALLPGPACCPSGPGCLFPPPPRRALFTQLTALCVSELRPGVHV